MTNSYISNRCRYGTPGQGGIEGSGDYDQCAALAAQLLEGGGAPEQEPAPGKLLVANGTEVVAAPEPKACRYVRCAMGGQFLPNLAPPEGQSRATDGGKTKGRAGGRSSVQGYRLQATESFYYVLKVRLGLAPKCVGDAQAYLPVSKMYAPAPPDIRSRRCPCCSTWACRPTPRWGRCRRRAAPSAGGPGQRCSGSWWPTRVGPGGYPCLSVRGH